jgi:hypothetical protein
VGKGGEKHGYGAFAKDDVDDARRGAPAGTLEAYPAARGLDYRGQARMSAFTGILPEYQEYIFNVVRGVLPGGGVGMLEHELQEVEVDQSRGIMWGGEFFGTRYAAKGKGFWNTVLPIDIFDKAPAKEPFAASASWAPVTAGVVRVPGSALLPRALVRRKECMTRSHPALDDLGAPGYRVSAPKSTAEVRAAMFGGDVAEVLRTFPHPHVELRFSHGGVALRRNGFVMDDGRLDDLAHAVSRVALGCRRRPRRCTTRNPSVRPCRRQVSTRPPDVPWYEWPFGPWVEMYAQAAGELGLTQEDPVEFHRAFPTQPVPGAANAVVRGPLPGWDIAGRSADGRLVFTVHGHGTENQVRAAVLIAAPASPPAFMPGGQLVPETDMYVEVVDGIAAMWNRVRTVGQLDAAPTLDRALATARKVGLLP